MFFLGCSFDNKSLRSADVFLSKPNSDLFPRFVVPNRTHVIHKASQASYWCQKCWNITICRKEKKISNRESAYLDVHVLLTIG